MASISGLQNNPTNNLNTIDGLQIINATSIYDDGVLVDTTNLVPYLGATQTVNLGTQNIQTSHAPTANNDLVNLLTLQNAVSYIEGINVANFVPYTGANANVDLGTYKVSSSTAPTTSNNLTNKNYVDTQDALKVPYTGATANVNLGSNTLTASTAKFTAITSATPALALGVDASGNLNTFAVPSSASFPFTGATNINGGVQTIQNAMQFNPTLDANSYFVVGVAPTTYILSTNWIINPVSGTTANISLDPALFYFDINHKYVITFTGIYGTSASWSGTVFNNSTSTTVSDSPIAITTTSQDLSMTFTAGSNNPTIYLRFVGASGTLRWTNFSIKEVDVEILGNLIIDSQINSNITQTNGKTANFSNALKVNQTSLATASSLTTASLPAGVSASTLSGTYTLTATAGGTTFGMWLGSSFIYTVGAKYTYTFTGFSTNATATQAMILYTNTYTGGSGTMIGDYVVNVPITSSTVSGSFTATSNNNVVWNFVASATGKSVSFASFTLTRGDTQITGVATLPTNTGTAIAGLGLNASNQIVTTTVPSNFSAVSVGYVPYKSATDTFSNSLTTQGSIDFGASLSAWTGIGSITYSAPTYTANSSASYQGIINITPPPYSYIGTLCTATFTNLSFPIFALSPYPYFTLTSGSTIVYTSPVNPSGTISIPFTSSSSLILFITIYFKAPPTGFTGGVLTWTNFTLTSSAMITTGNSITTGSVGIGITNPNKRLFVKEDTLLPSITSAQDFPAQVAIQSNTSWLKLGQYYQGGVGAWGVIQSSDYYSSAEHGINLGLNPLDGKVSIGGQEMSGIATRNPGQAISRFTIHSDYDNSASGFCINASDSAGDNYYMKLYPYVVASGVVGYNFNTYNSSTSYSPFSFNRNLVGINQTSPSYNLDVAGNMRVINADDSMTYYGANATWNAKLVVGSGTDKAGSSTAQVITTNGNLHMDAGNNNDMYYGYYANSRGTPNTHQFYGTSVNFPSGLPQNGTSFSQVAVFDGNTLKKSQATQRLVYFNNNVAWGGGVNMVNAFYLYNTACSVQFWGKNSGYYSGGGMMQTTIRCYSQSSGAYYYFPINAYVNNGYNHFTVPLNYSSTFPYTGWYDIYVYSTSGWITDGNDQLTIGVTILPASGY